MLNFTYPGSRCMSLWTPWPCWVFEDALKIAPAGWTLEHVATGQYRITPRPGDIADTQRTIAIPNTQWYDKDQPSTIAPFLNRSFVVAIYSQYYEVNCLDATAVPVDANFSLVIFSPG